MQDGWNNKQKLTTILVWAKLFESLKLKTITTLVQEIWEK